MFRACNACGAFDIDDNHACGGKPSRDWFESAQEDAGGLVKPVMTKEEHIHFLKVTIQQHEKMLLKCGETLDELQQEFDQLQKDFDFLDRANDKIILTKNKYKTALELISREREDWGNGAVYLTNAAKIASEALNG